MPIRILAACITISLFATDAYPLLPVVTTESKTIIAGDYDFTIDVSADIITDLYAYEIKFYIIPFDSQPHDSLTYVQGLSTDVVLSSYNQDNVDVIQLDEGMAATVLSPGMPVTVQNETIATFTFHCTESAYGVYYLRYGPECILSDDYMNSISYLPGCGYVTVIPEPSALCLLACGATLMFRKNRNAN